MITSWMLLKEKLHFLHFLLLCLEWSFVRSAGAASMNNITYGFRIVGGQEAHEGEFPFLVLLGRDYGGIFVYMCAGSIITPRTIVTAAHCGNFYNVLAGEHNTKEQSGEEIVGHVREVIPHPEWKGDDHDIALAILSEPLPLGPRPGNAVSLKAAKLPDEEIRKAFTPGTSVTVMGWGTIKYGGHKSHFLKKVNLRVIEKGKCVETYEKEAPADAEVITESMFCAGGPAGETPCKGDSGGPAVLTQRPGVIVGIVSWGVACNELPSVYTDIYYYREWINTHKVD